MTLDGLPYPVHPPLPLGRVGAWERRGAVHVGVAHTGELGGSPSRAQRRSEWRLAAANALGGSSLSSTLFGSERAFLEGLDRAMTKEWYHELTSPDEAPGAAPVPRMAVEAMASPSVNLIGLACTAPTSASRDFQGVCVLLQAVRRRLPHRRVRRVVAAPPRYDSVVHESERW